MQRGRYPIGDMNTNHDKPLTGFEPAIIKETKSVGGFEPPNNEVAAHHLKPLGYTLKINNLISLCLAGSPLLVNHFL